MRPENLTAALALLFLFPVTAAAATIHVKKGTAIDTIQDGIDAAAAGDVVKIHAGIYQENPVVPLGKNGLRLVADGQVRIEALGAGGAKAGPGLTIGSADVTVVGIEVRNAFTLDATHLGFGIDVAGNGFTLRSCRLVGNVEGGVRVEGNDVRISDCEFRGNGDGVVLKNGQFAVVRDSVFRTGGRSGLVLDAYCDVDVRECTFAVLSDNGVTTSGSGSCRIQVRSCAFRNNDSGGIFLEADDCVVSDNDLLMVGVGIQIDGTNGVIRKNRVRRTTDEGIRVDAAAAGTVEKNDVRECGGSGVRLRPGAIGVIVRNNLVTDVFGDFDAGYLVEGNSCVVEANRALRCPDGIRVPGDLDTIAGNAIDDCARDGIDVTDTAGATTITDNVVTDCAAEGFDHEGGGTVATGNSFTRCRIDVANAGAFFDFSGNTFDSGGTLTLPEID